MVEKYRLCALALGTLLCGAVPAVTYAQDKLERSQELQMIDGRSPEAITALTAPATGVATSEIARGNVATRTGIEVQLLRVPPLGRAGSELTDLVAQSDRMEIVVTLTGAPPDLVSPALIAEIHEGTCLSLKSALVRTTEHTADAYPLTPSVFSLRSFGAILPVSFVGLRSSAHAITVRSAPEAAGNTALACVDIA